MIMLLRQWIENNFSLNCFSQHLGKKIFAQKLQLPANCLMNSYVMSWEGNHSRCREITTDSWILSHSLNRFARIVVRWEMKNWRISLSFTSNRARFFSFDSTIVMFKSSWMKRRLDNGRERMIEMLFMRLGIVH